MATLEQLPARVEDLAGQILQLRTEMRDEFSAVRAEIRAGDEDTRRIVNDQLRSVSDQLSGQFSEQLRATRDELMTHARMLHEDVLSRIALIGESRRRRKKTR